jgi:hypothetical protein
LISPQSTTLDYDSDLTLMDKSYLQAVAWLLKAASRAEQVLRANQCFDAADELSGAIQRMEKREQARIRLDSPPEARK